VTSLGRPPPPALRSSPVPGSSEHISAQRPASDEDGDGLIPQGYACLRDLEPPHPGDPGGGGGPRGIPGDCLYGRAAARSGRPPVTDRPTAGPSTG
jgi:hypothetical protein